MEENFNNSSEIGTKEVLKDKEMEKLERQKQEIENKIKTRKFRDDVKNNPILKEQGITTVKKRTYLFWKILAIVWTVIFLILITWFIYGVYTGHLDDFKPYYNNPINITNNIESPAITTTTPIQNDYTHNIDSRDYNNYTIIVNNYIVKNETS